MLLSYVHFVCKETGLMNKSLKHCISSKQDNIQSTIMNAETVLQQLPTDKKK